MGEGRRAKWSLSTLTTASLISFGHNGPNQWWRFINLFGKSFIELRFVSTTTTMTAAMHYFNNNNTFLTTKDCLKKTKSLRGKKHYHEFTVYTSSPLHSSRPYLTTRSSRHDWPNCPKLRLDSLDSLCFLFLLGEQHTFRFFAVQRHLTESCIPFHIFSIFDRF